MADRITELQRELLAICRGGYAYETWANVTEQPISERTDWRGRVRGQKRVDEIRRELHAINPDAALYFGWGPDERPQARELFYAEATNRAIEAGKQAREDGQPRTANPYKRDGERTLWHPWDIGWCHTRAEEDAAIGVEANAVIVPRVLIDRIAKNLFAATLGLSAIGKAESDAIMDELRKLASGVQPSDHGCGKGRECWCEEGREIAACEHRKVARGVNPSAQLDADVARLMAMSEAEIDAELRSMGMDPTETAERGRQAIERALATIRARNAGVPPTHEGKL